ncbi:response regulator [Paludibaculum fermentans]|uniref:response regulator n=1 Tax=Paludibaculum fermentans TaxID=1473598 RepID=UPI003EBF52E2
MSSELIRILVVDDHPAIRKGLEAVLSPEPDVEVVASAGSRKEAVEAFRTSRPDVTLMDLGLEGETGGLETIQDIRKEFPTARIIVYSALRGDEDVYRALQFGAVTFVPKETPEAELLRIIRDVHAGGRPIPPDTARKLADRVTLSSLTPREVEVLRQVAGGMRNKEIAAELGISEETVQGHMKNILSKLNVNDRTAAAIVAAQRGIIHLR